MGESTQAKQEEARGQYLDCCWHCIFRQVGLTVEVGICLYCALLSLLCFWLASNIANVVAAREQA